MKRSFLPVVELFVAASMAAHGQFREIGPPPFPADAAREQIRTLLEKVDPGNTQPTVKKLSDLAVWYRDILDDELIAAWRRDDRAKLTEVIEPLADAPVASGIVSFSWRERRQDTFTPANAPLLENLMIRYGDSAKPFLDDLLASTASGRQTLELSQPEAEIVCRILLDAPDIRTWKQSALQILPHYRPYAMELLYRDLNGSDPAKSGQARRWLNDLGAAGSLYGAQPSTPRPPVAPRAPSRPGMACVAPPSGMVAWWSGDSNMNDLVGGHNPSMVNAVSLVPGVVGNGFKFGFQGYLEIPHSPDLENQRFTWLAWVRPDGPGPNASSLIINQDIDATHASVNLAWCPSDRRFTFHSGHQAADLIVSNDQFPAGKFYLVAATYDGEAFELRVNGILEGSLSETKKIAYSSFGWEIGAGALRFFPKFADTFNGVIDEIQGYNRALPADEILSIFQAGSAGVCKDAGASGVPSTANRPPANERPSSAGAPATTAPAGTNPAVDGSLRKLGEKDLHLQTSSETVLRFRLLAKTTFRDRQGAQIRDSLLHPGDHLSVLVNRDDPETAVQVVLLSNGTAAERESAEQPIRDDSVRAPELEDLEKPRAVLPPGDNDPRPAAVPELADQPWDAVRMAVEKQWADMSKPKVLRKADPAYSQEARIAHISGTVILLVVVDVNGRAKEIKIVKGKGLGYGLDERAIDCVRKWEFAPAKKNGQPVPAYATVEVNFRLL